MNPRPEIGIPSHPGIVSQLLHEIGICSRTGTERQKVGVCPSNTGLKPPATANRQRQSLIGQKENRPLLDSTAPDDGVGKKEPWILRKPDLLDFHDVEGFLDLP
jgi:hypothetical protein